MTCLRHSGAETRKGVRSTSTGKVLLMQAACHLWPGALAIRGTGVLKIEFVEDSSLTSEVLLHPYSFSLAVQKQSLELVGALTTSVSRIGLHISILCSSMPRPGGPTHFVAFDIAQHPLTTDTVSVALSMLTDSLPGRQQAMQI